MKLASLAAVALLGLAFHRVGQQPPTVEELTAKVRDALSHAKGLSMRIEETGGQAPFELRVRASRHNLYAVEGPVQCFYSDGGTAIQYFPKENAYNRLPPSRIGRNVPVTGAFALYDPEPSYKPPFGKVEIQEFEGKKVFAMVDEVKQMPGLFITLLIDPETFLPVAERQTSPQSTHTSIFRDLKTDEQFKPEDFAWTPPPGAKDLDKEKSVSRILPVGAEPPEFSAKLLSGGEVSLKEALKGKKALLLNFWFYGCGGCMKEFPEVQSAYSRLSSKGLGVLTVNPVDDLNTVKTYILGLKYSVPAAYDVAPKESIQKYLGPDKGYPTSYLIGPDGKIAYACTGYSPESFREMLKKLKELGVG